MLLSSFIHSLACQITDRRKRNKLLNVGRLISAFSEFLQKEIYTNSFSQELTTVFISFLRSKNYRPGTVRNYYQILAYILSRAGRCHDVDVGYMNVQPQGEPPIGVYLTMTEIEALHRLVVSNVRLADIRDMFVIACLTGLRYSDFSRLSADNIRDGCICVKTKKTGAYVEIPLHPFVLDVLKSRNFSFPKVPSCYSMNRNLFNLCKQAGIDSHIRWQETRGDTTTWQHARKYELITTHTARRSFATNIYLASKVSFIPLYRIMLMTGHKTEGSFFRYIRINHTDNVKIMAEHPFFKL